MDVPTRRRSTAPIPAPAYLIFFISSLVKKSPSSPVVLFSSFLMVYPILPPSCGTLAPTAGEQGQIRFCRIAQRLYRLCTLCGNKWFIACASDFRFYCLAGRFCRCGFLYRRWLNFFFRLTHWLCRFLMLRLSYGSASLAAAASCAARTTLGIWVFSAILMLSASSEDREDLHRPLITLLA